MPGPVPARDGIRWQVGHIFRVDIRRVSDNQIDCTFGKSRNRSERIGMTLWIDRVLRCSVRQPPARRERYLPVDFRFREGISTGNGDAAATVHISKICCGCLLMSPANLLLSVHQSASAAPARVHRRKIHDAEPGFVGQVSHRNALVDAAVTRSTIRCFSLEVRRAVRISPGYPAAGRAMVTPAVRLHPTVIGAVTVPDICRAEAAYRPGNMS